MTHTVAILRVNPESFADIKARIEAINERVGGNQYGHMFMQGGQIDLSQIAIEIDPEAPPGPGTEPDIDYQASVHAWAVETFGEPKAMDVLERQWRFAEEAIELTQSLGMDRAAWDTLLDYVYGRPAGEPAQEVGGTMVGLAALCAAAGLDMMHAAMCEYIRINQPSVQERIRAKQKAKTEAGLYTNQSPLPGNPDAPPAPVVSNAHVHRMTGGDGFDTPYRELRHHAIVIRLHNSDRDTMKFTPVASGEHYVFSMDRDDDTIYLKGGPFSTHTRARRFIDDDAYYEGMSYLIGRGTVE